MREYGDDSPYMFLHCGFSIVTSLVHPEGGGGGEEEMLKILRTIPV